MGRYASAQDVVDRYQSANNIGLAKIDSVYLFFAEAELDAYLAPSFTFPFSTNNITVRDLAVDLAYAKMANLKFKERKEFKDEIMVRIKRLCDGEDAMLLDDNTAVYAVGDTVVSIGRNTYTPIFGVGDIEDFHPDPNQIEDETIKRNNW